MTAAAVWQRWQHDDGGGMMMASRALSMAGGVVGWRRRRLDNGGGAGTAVAASTTTVARGLLLRIWGHGLSNAVSPLSSHVTELPPDDRFRRSSDGHDGHAPRGSESLRLRGETELWMAHGPASGPSGTRHPNSPPQGPARLSPWLARVSKPPYKLLVPPSLSSAPKGYRRRRSFRHWRADLSYWLGLVWFFFSLFFLFVLRCDEFAIEKESWVRFFCLFTCYYYALVSGWRIGRRWWKTARKTHHLSGLIWRRRACNDANSAILMSIADPLLPRLFFRFFLKFLVFFSSFKLFFCCCILVRVKNESHCCLRWPVKKTSIKNTIFRGWSAAARRPCCHSAILRPTQSGDDVGTAIVVIVVFYFYLICFSMDLSGTCDEIWNQKYHLSGLIWLSAAMLSLPRSWGLTVFDFSYFIFHLIITD